MTKKSGKKAQINMKLFILNYLGNKYSETNKYLNDVNVHKYDIIAEPFCGIFGFSRCLYALNPDYKGKFYLNDINTDLITIINKLRNKEERELLFGEIEEIINKFEGHEDRELSAFLKKSDNYFLKCVFMSNCSGLFSLKKGITKLSNYKKVIENYDLFFERCVFTNMNSEDFMKSLPTDKKILCFYDPPYFDSDNTYYSDRINENDETRTRRDNTYYYVDIINNFKNNDKVDHLMILNKIDVINYIFKDYFKQEYSKIYGSSKHNRTSHVVYEKIYL